VDDDLALEQFGEILADGRQRAVRHRNQQHIAECCGLAGRAGTGFGSEARREFPVVLEIERGEHDLVARLDPRSAERGSDPAGSDRADLELCVLGEGDARRERKRAQRYDEPGEAEKVAACTHVPHATSAAPVRPILRFRSGPNGLYQGDSYTVTRLRPSLLLR